MDKVIPFIAVAALIAFAIFGVYQLGWGGGRRGHPDRNSTNDHPPA